MPIVLMVGTRVASGPAAGMAASPAPAARTAAPLPSARTLVSGFGEPPTGTLDPTKAAALQALIDDFVAQGAPDVLAAVSTPDGIGFGPACVSGPDGHPATPDAEFAIASITKSFMATLIMRLVEQGKMDLDAPLASYRPFGRGWAASGRRHQVVSRRRCARHDTPSADPGRTAATAPVRADTLPGWHTTKGSPNGSASRSGRATT